VPAPTIAERQSALGANDARAICGVSAICVAARKKAAEDTEVAARKKAAKAAEATARMKAAEDTETQRKREGTRFEEEGSSPDPSMRLGGHNDTPGSVLSDDDAMIASLQAKILDAERKKMKKAKIAELQAALREQVQTESKVETTPATLRGRKRSSPSSDSNSSADGYHEASSSKKKRRQSLGYAFSPDDYKKRRKSVRDSKQRNKKVSAVVMQIIQLLCLIVRINYM